MSFDLRYKHNRSIFVQCETIVFSVDTEHRCFTCGGFSVNQFIKEQLKKVLPATMSQASFAGKNTEELLWAEVFNSTVCESSWLLNKSFSLCRAAISYLGLYLLYRVLDEMKPKSILEMGLGQSTKMISQFVSQDQQRIHYVVENNKDWAAFYLNNNTVPQNTKLTMLTAEIRPFKSANVRAYKDFKETFGTKRFDYIAIDGPGSYDMKKYSRIDVLSILPDCLNSSFVITLDDAQRNPEKATAREVCSALDAAHIKYRFTTYYGLRGVALWASEDWGFLCSL